MDYLGEFDQIVRILMEMRDAKLYSIIQINLIIQFVKPRFITPFMRNYCEYNFCIPTYGKIQNSNLSTISKVIFDTDIRKQQILIT